MTVDGVEVATLDDYDGLEFFLKRERRRDWGGADLRLIISSEQQSENVWLLAIDDVDEEEGQ